MNKNSWLNFTVGMLGFYFVFSLLNTILEKVGTKVVSTTTHFSLDFYWLVAFVVAFLISLTLIIIFCKPRAPLFVGLAILIGSAASMYYTLYSSIVNLDKYFHSEGLVAIQHLLPHLVVILAALLAMFIAWFSNRASQS